MSPHLPMPNRWPRGRGWLRRNTVREPACISAHVCPRQATRTYAKPYTDPLAVSVTLDEAAPVPKSKPLGAALTEAVLGRIAPKDRVVEGVTVVLPFPPPPQPMNVKSIQVRVKRDEIIPIRGVLISLYITSPN